SLGQYIQEGERHLFQTILQVKEAPSDITIEATDDNLDGLNYLAGKTVNEVNEKAFQGALLAHTDGGVPNMVVTVPKLDAFTFGYLVYFYESKTVNEVKAKAFQGALLVHTDGGVPNMVVSVPKLDAFTFGYLVYFFEKACALSGYLLGVNPFDQPGVEGYKQNMFSLLGK